MLNRYYSSPYDALDYAKKFLGESRRKHVLIGRTPKGYLLIDPRNKKSHYCQIVAKLYNKQS